MTATPNRDQLPKGLANLLKRGARTTGGARVLPPLDEHVQEAIAREAINSGVKTAGPAFEYVVKRLRYGMGRGDLPSMPTLSEHERAFIDRRISESLGRLQTERRAA